MKDTRSVANEIGSELPCCERRAWRYRISGPLQRLTFVARRPGAGILAGFASVPESHPQADAGSALCALADGSLALGALDGTIRLWGPAIGAETARLELDAPAIRTISLVTSWDDCTDSM
jgi:hypothetical protein